MVSKEEAIAELAKLLANGAISPETFAMSVSALNNAGSSSNSESNQPPKEKTRDEKIYETVMEYIRNRMISPSTVKYPPFSECKIDTEVGSSIFLNLPEFLTTDETGKYLLTKWDSYFDVQNRYGAMIRERCGFVFDENKNLIYAYYTDNEKILYAPLDIVKDFVIHEDTIEEELYYKYISEYSNRKGKWSYLPYNKRMLRTTEKRAFGDLLDFTGKIIKVTFIYSMGYSNNTSYEWYNSYDDVIIILDGKDTFNLIRIIESRKLLKGDGTLTLDCILYESDASKN